MKTANDIQCHDRGPCGHDRSGGLFFGGAFIIAGLAFLGGELNWLHDHSPWDFWPALLLWLGLVKLFSWRIGAGVFFLLAGSACMVWSLSLLALQWSLIWPVLLIAAGLMIFFSGVLRKGRRSTSVRPFSADFFEASIVLGGQQREILSQSFEGGDIRCVMGGLELDMRRARMKEKETTLKVKLTMGGLELKVPETWEVVLKGDPVLGGFENRNRGPVHSENCDGRLILDTEIVMGGIEVRN